MKGGVFQSVSPRLMVNMWGLYALNIQDPSFTIIRGFTALFYSIVLQHGFTALFYNMVLQHCFTAWFYSIVLQQVFTALFYSMVLQHCFTAWFYSIVLPAFADYSYRFLKAEVGCEGRISDGGVYRSSNFYSALKKQQLNLPEPHPIPRSSEPFWESTHRTKPFGFKNASDMERIFDYRQFRFNRK